MNKMERQDYLSFESQRISKKIETEKLENSVDKSKENKDYDSQKKEIYELGFKDKYRGEMPFTD